MFKRIKILALAAAVTVIATASSSGVEAHSNPSMDNFVAFADNVVRDEFKDKCNISCEGSSFIVTTQQSEKLDQFKQIKLQNISGMLFDAMMDYGVQDGHVIIDVEKNDGSGNTMSLFADGRCEI